MTSRERLLKALNHEEPDRIPFDLSSTQVTGIANGAYENLLKFLNMPNEEREMSDVVQQLAQPSEAMLQRLEVDTRGLFPKTSHNWNIENNLFEEGDYIAFIDEWGMKYHMPKHHGNWYSIVSSPLEYREAINESLTSHRWPIVNNKERIVGLRARALQWKSEGKAVVIKGLCAGVFEMAQRLRGMENALMDPMINPDFSDRIIGKVADLKIDFWNMVLGELHDVVDVVLEADDYGSQTSQLIDPDQFRAVYKPHVKRILAAIKTKAPQVKILFHSCGNIRPIIPDFIEIGVDIINPVHITATGMDPFQLKKDFGKDICFWGGGIETQHILPNGTLEQIADDVKRNIDALAPGGGFVFNTVHNIQREVPPQNIMAMWEALRKYGKY